MHVSPTAIPGLLIVALDVHGDNRGWFKENWQREKMVAAGLPDFRPVQNNISFNAQKGVTRGLHAEPWDKLVSVAHGRVFGAWCDLRQDSPTFGEIVTHEIGPDTAVFVPRGVANGFQALEDNTSYAYLVNAHWSPEAQYSMVNLKEVQWPLEPTEISAKDAAHPALADATPLPRRRILVTGAGGQLGRALQDYARVHGLTHLDFVTRAEFDICAVDAPFSTTASTSAKAAGIDFSAYEAIINCAAFNDVNGAEEQRAAAWEANALAPGALARIANEHNLTLVHVSTDYVFAGIPGTVPAAGHPESETPSPLSLYGAAKAAGEASASGARKHYVVRTAWVFGEGNNFVGTMAALAARGVNPKVIADQRGRPTWAGDLAAGIMHLLDTGAEYGIYNLTSGGDIVGRDELARAAFAAAGADPTRVESVSSEEYAAAFGPEPARRPHESALDLAKIAATGFVPGDWRAAVQDYVSGLNLQVD